MREIYLKDKCRMYLMKMTKIMRRRVSKRLATVMPWSGKRNQRRQKNKKLLGLNKKMPKRKSL